MLNSFSVYEKSKNRLVLTNQELGVSNLRMIGRAYNQTAVLPLQEHIHLHCMEMVVLLTGKQMYFSDGQAYALSGGEMFTSFANQPHGSGNIPQEINEIIWFQIDMRYQDGFLGLDSNFGKKLYKKLSNWSHSIISLETANIQIIKDAFQKFSTQSKESIMFGTNLLITFLLSLFENRQNIHKDNSMEEIIQYIQDHIGEELISISDLANRCNLSESRFKHKFSECIGMSPRYYINDQKIQKAKSLLEKNPKLSITNLAHMLGFNTSSYFSVVFKKYTGFTPTEYATGFK